MRQLRERVRRERRDHEQVGLDEVRVELPRRFTPGESLEGLRGHERLGLLGQDRRHLVAGLDQQTREFGRLVGRDSARHTKENPGHTNILPLDARLQWGCRLVLQSASNSLLQRKPRLARPPAPIRGHAQAELR